MAVETRNFSDTSFLEAKTFDGLEQVRLFIEYVRIVLKNGGIEDFVPWISIETAKQFFASMGSADFASFPRVPFLGHIIFVNSTEASREVLKFDHTHLAPDSFQERMFSLTRGKFILSTNDKEEWREERRVANPAFNPSGLEKDKDRIKTVVNRGVAQFKEASEKEPLSTRVRMMVASVLMETYLGHNLSVDDALAMVKSFESFSKFGAIAVLGGTDIPIVKNFFLHLLNNFHSTLGAHVSKHMPKHDGLESNTPFQKHVLAGFSKQDLDIAIDRVRSLSAGMNSVTTATQLLLYMLGSDQQLQAKVRESIALGKDDEIDSLLEQMATQYIIPINSVRRVTEDFAVSGTTFKKGTLVMLPHIIWKPDEKQDKRAMPNFDLQFGTGPRVCIGKHLAKMLLENITREFILTTDTITALNHPTPVVGPVAVRPSEPFQISIQWKQ